nr:enoyl-CoA hydratase/isomerase family protein [Gellertiella hungarica]
MSAEQELLVSRHGSLGIIVLNRPKVLNSLSLAMVREMEKALDGFEAEPAVRAILMIGAGDRAFCAGGDIRALYDAGKAGDSLPETFWREEYLLDERISRFPKPVIAVMNGITMGGGVGLAAHASHRIVIERTKFAMPEAGIGFFPDVGASWLLTRTPGEFGTYIALTGVNCGPAETIRAGIADCFVPEADLEALKAALASLPENADAAAVTDTVRRFARDAAPTVESAALAVIDGCLAHDRMEEIVAALSAEGSDFALKTRDLLLGKSPTSLKVTLDLYRQGRRAASLRECLEREFAVTAGMIAGHDFYEGVRAAIIDKDRNPQWSPRTLDGVTAADVSAYFIPRHRPLFNPAG